MWRKDTTWVMIPHYVSFQLTPFYSVFNINTSGFSQPLTCLNWVIKVVLKIENWNLSQKIYNIPVWPQNATSVLLISPWLYSNHSHHQFFQFVISITFLKQCDEYSKWIFQDIHRGTNLLKMSSWILKHSKCRS